MILALALGLLGNAQTGKQPPDDWYMGLETVDPSLQIDWAQRYVSIDGNFEFAVRLHGVSRQYSVTGYVRQGAKPPEKVSGSFSQVYGKERGPIRLHSATKNWKGEWNRRQGCFELFGTGSLQHLKLWQQLTPISLDMLEGNAPLEKPHDVPDHLMGIPTETEALYGFRADFDQVVELADRELRAAGWKKWIYKTWGFEPFLLCPCYGEPGPEGRSVCIQPDSSVPDSNAFSDIIVSGTRCKGWVGVSISSPKVHG